MSFDNIKIILETPSIGLFKNIELIEVIGIQHEAPPFNIFTLAVAQEINSDLVSECKLTEKPIPLKGDKSIKLGVFKSITSIDDFLSRIQKLDNNQWENNKQKPLLVGKLKSIPAVYVPALEDGKNEFLGLLKNNFFDGSYIFEWFDVSKEHVSRLMENRHVLMELSEKLQTILPIKIGSHSDRLGNFIVQIPCSSVAFKIERKDQDSNHLISNLSINPTIKEKLNLSGIFWREQNDSIIDFQKMTLELGENIIPFKQINGAGYYTILDEDRKMICSGGKINLCLESINSHTSLENYDQRIFKLPNSEEQRVDMSITPPDHRTGKNNAKDYRDWVRNRLIKFERSELHDLLKLRQFKQNMRKEALDFIRKLIYKYGKDGVYLWDPYLSAKDLLKTVFFSPYANTPIKALTGLKEVSKDNNNTSKNYKDELEQSIAQLGGLDLTFLKADRAEVGDFHDRFIIFPQNKDEPARVWSLGTSVNSLGKSHHIIQEVEDGQIIADVFEEMWKHSIINKDNVIWKSKSN